MFSGVLCLSVFTLFQTACACDRNTFLTIEVKWHSAPAAHPETIYSWSGLMDFKQAYKIEVTDQNISVICPNSIADLPKLVQLHLNRNHIPELRQNAFKNVPMLQELSLANNSLKIIEEGIFNNMNLAVLNLNGNSITEIDQKAFDNMTNLKALSLGYNKIKYINNQLFKNCSRLQFLNLEHNQITFVPENAFQHLSGKVTHDRYDFYLTIQLNNNKIRSFQTNAFAKLEGLGELIVDNNEIGELDENLFANFKFFKTFSIGFNNISCLPEKLDGILKARELIYMDGNPWDCRCAERIRRYAFDRGLNFQIEYSLSRCKEEVLPDGQSEELLKRN